VTRPTTARARDGEADGHAGASAVNRDGDAPSRRHAPRCPVCTVPVAPGTIRLYEGGEFFHASCRSVQITRAALRQHGAGDPTVNMAGATGGSPESEQPAILSQCPICHESATVVRGIADAAWYAVDGCACAGYVVAADALEWRLSRLTAAERAELVATLQGFRAMGRDAWLSTGDGSISGRLVIRTQSPRRSS
jgi:hypothetical protein